MSTNAYGESKKTEGFRRTWDNEAYAKKARDREQQNRLADEDEERRRKGLKPRTRVARPTEARELLQPRKQAVDLEGMVGKVQIVQASTAAAGQPGFYCKVCDVTVKDSLSYLDHINGKNHQRVLNRSMKVASESVDDVLAKLQSLRELKRRQQQQTKAEYSFQEQVNQQQQAEQQKRDKRREARRRQRQAKARAAGSKSPSPDADDMGLAMGFASFGSTKK
ncbi:U4/U6.U5 snRNP associated protein [Coemansia sp. S16]|nr:U4/U6.U5 snRNP associated protein [Coemansia sp. S16]